MSAHLVFDLDRLRERSEEVNPLSAKKTIDDLKSKLNKYPELIALSAPQIGTRARIIALKFKGGNIKIYVNPMIMKSSDLHLVREKDVSIAEKEFICLRPRKIHIRYQDEFAKPEENILNGEAAEIFDRMINYLDGITLEDIGLEVLEGWDEATEEEKAQIIDLYIQSLKRREEYVNDLVKEDKDASELKKAIDFDTKLSKGEIETIKIEENELNKKKLGEEKSEK